MLKGSRGGRQFCSTEGQHPLRGTAHNCGSAGKVSTYAVMDRDGETEIETNML